MVEQLNVVLFSDHGMTEIQWMEKVVELDKYINMSDITKMMDRGAVVSLWPKDNKFEEVRVAYLFFQPCCFFCLSTLHTTLVVCKKCHKTKISPGKKVCADRI